MAIRPTDGTDLTRVTSSTGKTKKQAARPEDAERQSREARERLDSQREYFKDAEVELSRNYDRMRDEYGERASTESARQEDALETQRAKGYEAVRDLKRAQDIELGRMKAAGDKRMEELKTRYRTARSQLEKTGRTEFKQIQTRQAHETEQTRKAGESALSEVKATSSQTLAHLEQDRDLRMEQAAQAYQKEYQRIKATSGEAMEAAEARYLERFEKALVAQDETFERINSRSSESLNKLRSDHAGKLAVYETKQEDPFYQLVDLGPDLEDTGDSFVLRVAVPEYEQESVKVSFRGNETLVLSGYRRNEDKLELETGRVKRTAAFQSFSETLPLPAPVDAKRMSREYDDGELVVRIPKMGPYAAKKIYQSQKPERARVERPDFPKNLASSDSGTVSEHSDSSGRSKKFDRTLG